MTRPSPFTIPGAEPTLLRGGPNACLLLHGLASHPGEMKFLAEDLHQRGYTVLNARLAGHGTRPSDLGRVRWTDWLITVEEGLSLLDGLSKQSILIGRSLGGMVALTSAARLPVAGVVALAIPYPAFSASDVFWGRSLGRLGLMTSRHVQPGFPTYGRFPLRVLAQVARLEQEMRSALPLVRVPTLLVQSRQSTPGRQGLEKIHADLASTRREVSWSDSSEHSLLLGEDRAQVFRSITGFLASLDE